MIRALTIATAAAMVWGCSQQPDSSNNQDSVSATGNAPIRILLASDVDYQDLNPARGAMSPRAGTLWGDRAAGVPTGFLAEFKDGFSSPPHIHNATYRATVISGGIHNDDPDAAAMWMGPGSFWTQPKGETHITAALGPKNIALVEIDKGPYLVMPPSKAFDSGERPVNVDASNIVWLPASKPLKNGTIAELAYLWGDVSAGESRGLFVRLPAGFAGSIQAAGDTFHGVVIQGSLEHHASQGKPLEPGSYFGASAASNHQISTAGKQLRPSLRPDE